MNLPHADREEVAVQVLVITNDHPRGVRAIKHLDIAPPPCAQAYRAPARFFLHALCEFLHTLTHLVGV